jgi:hypothetical protein
MTTFSQHRERLLFVLMDSLQTQEKSWSERGTLLAMGFR